KPCVVCRPREREEDRRGDHDRVGLRDHRRDRRLSRHTGSRVMIPIAVIGIDCRFPGAPDKEAFWQLLMDGKVADTEIPSQRWNVDTYYDRDGGAGSMNTRRGHFIDGVDAFDNDFFGIAPIEAAALDPQQRLLLQTSWRAVEDGGIDPRSLAGTPTGVFVGVM